MKRGTWRGGTFALGLPADLQETISADKIRWSAFRIVVSLIDLGRTSPLRLSGLFFGVRSCLLVSDGHPFEQEALFSSCFSPILESSILVFASSDRSQTIHCPGMRSINPPSRCDQSSVPSWNDCAFGEQDTLISQVARPFQAIAEESIRPPRALDLVRLDSLPCVILFPGRNTR